MTLLNYVFVIISTLRTQYTAWNGKSKSMNQTTNLASVLSLYHYLECCVQTTTNSTECFKNRKKKKTTVNRIEPAFIKS